MINSSHFTEEQTEGQTRTHSKQQVVLHLPWLYHNQHFLEVLTSDFSEPRHSMAPVAISVLATTKVKGINVKVSWVLIWCSWTLSIYQMRMLTILTHRVESGLSGLFKGCIARGTC